MKLEKWALIGEIVGSFAIVVTLVILIFEVRGNTGEIRAATLADIARRTQEFALLNARSRQLAELYAKFDEGEELSSADLMQLGSVTIGALKLAEESFIAERDGRLDPEIWETRAAFVIAQLNRKVLRDQYVSFRESAVLVPEFTDWLDLALREAYGE